MRGEVRAAAGVLLALGALTSSGCGHSQTAAPLPGPRTMSHAERGRLSQLGTIVQNAGNYPVAFAGEGAHAIAELMRICRTRRSWLASTNPRRTVAEVVRQDASAIRASRPDLAESLDRC